MNGPSPADPHPMPGFPQVCYIKNIVRNPNIVIGDYTYYDDPEDPETSSATCCTTSPSSATSS